MVCWLKLLDISKAPWICTNCIKRGIMKALQAFAAQQMGRRRRAEYDDGVTKTENSISITEYNFIRRKIMAIAQAVANSFKKRNT